MRDGWEQRKEGNDDDPNLNKVENAGNGGGDLAWERNMYAKSCETAPQVSPHLKSMEHIAHLHENQASLFGLYLPPFDSSLLRRRAHADPRSHASLVR